MVWINHTTTAKQTAVKCKVLLPLIKSSRWGERGEWGKDREGHRLLPTCQLFTRKMPTRHLPIFLAQTQDCINLPTTRLADVMTFVLLSVLWSSITHKIMYTSVSQYCKLFYFELIVHINTGRGESLHSTGIESIMTLRHCLR